MQIKFKFPSFDLLKIPTKKERENYDQNETHNSENIKASEKISESSLFNPIATNELKTNSFKSS